MEEEVVEEEEGGREGRGEVAEGNKEYRVIGEEEGGRESRGRGRRKR